MSHMHLFKELSEHVMLRVYSCMDVSHENGWIESKAHADYDLWFVLSGSIHVRIGDDAFEARAGDAIFFYPHVLYTSYTEDEQCRFIYTHFEFGIGNHYRILDGFKLSGVVPGALIAEEAELFCESFKLYKQNRNMSGLRLKGCLFMMLAKIMDHYESGSYAGEFVRHPPRSHAKHADMLQSVFQFIHENAHRTIPVGELAAVAGMAEKYFITLFKKTFGVTPGQYVYQLKMNRARDYLYQRKYSVKEIAGFLGYPDPYTFSKAFKKYYNVPPSRFGV